MRTQSANIKHRILNHWNVLISALILSAATVLTQSAFAQAVSVTGGWTGSTLANGSVYPNIYTLVQGGTVLSGSQIANGQNCQLAGTVTGTQIQFHTDCPTLNYSSDATGVTDGNSMSGTFLDSQFTSGTFTAIKTVKPLQPETTLNIPPVINVQGTKAVFTCQNFSGVSLAKANSRALRARTPKLTAQFELEITGAEKRKVISKKNVITVKNLKPGSYTAKYKVTALKDGKKAFSTKPSPKNKFTISKK